MRGICDDVPVGEHVPVRADHEPGPVVAVAAEGDGNQSDRALTLLRHAGEIGPADRPQLGIEAGGLHLRRADRVPETIDQLLGRCAALGSRQLIPQALQVPLRLFAPCFARRELLSQRLLCPVQGGL